MAAPLPGVHGLYPHDDEKFTVFPGRRSVVHSTKGIVSTTSPLASQAGLRILQEGGNAADAAVAAAAVLNLVDPSMTGIGGDAFCLFYEAETRKVRALNGSGRSPAGATLDAVCGALGVEDRSAASIPALSIHSVTVPGAAAAWVDIVERFGSGSMPLSRVLAPAIELAESGFAVSEISSYAWVKCEQELKSAANGSEVLKQDPNAPGGFRSPRSGEHYRNPNLAKTFRLLAEKGRAGFYEGSVAQAIVDVSKELGGFLTLEDLKHHGDVGSEASEPIKLRLDSPVMGSVGSGLDLWEHGPNGQGLVAQIALGLLQEFEKDGKITKFAPEDHNSPRYLHALIQALRIAFADGAWYITDPSSTAHDPTSLLTPAYLASRARLFDPAKASPAPARGGPRKTTSDTIYLAVADQRGNACSLVNSVADLFGSRIGARGAGFVLQNRGTGFHLHPPDQPNAYAPAKRPYNTIIPALVTHGDGGGLHSVLGVMGGAMQPQGHVQVLLNMLVFGMNPQVALDAPRVCVGINLPGKATDPSKRVDEAVYLEEGIGQETVRGLEEMGYEVKVVKGMGRSLFGRGQVIRVHHDSVDGQRVYSAGSDMRGDGFAAPL